MIGLEELVRRNTRKNRERPLRRKVARDGQPKVGADGLHCHGCGKDNASADFVEHRDHPGTFHVVWWCNTCGPSFRLADAAAAVGMDWRAVQHGNEVLFDRYGEEPERPSVGLEQVEEWHDRLWFDRKLMRFLNEKRMVSCRFIREHKIGHDGDRYVLPVWDEVSQRYVNLRRYDPNPSPGEPKIRSLLNSGVHLWPRVPTGDTVDLLEGEWDCAAAASIGYPALTNTGGALTWRPEWSERLAGKRVHIIYDQDKAGVEGASMVGSALREVGCTVFVVKLPLAYRETKGPDVTDLLRKRHGAARLRASIRWAEERQEPRPKPRPSSSSVVATSRRQKAGR